MGYKRVLFVVAACLSLFSNNLFAQRGYTARTAEYLTATSDLVVMAVVANLKVERNSSSDEKSGLETITAILDVHRCLKGYTDNSVKLQIELPSGSDNLAKWLENEVELFWFLNLDSPNDQGIVKIVPHRELRFTTQ
jgi:hypothetical protein